MPRWAPASLALALVGCTIEADYSDTRFACDRDDDCPIGFACSAGTCTSSGGDPGDGAPPTRCGEASELRDDFEDGAVSSGWLAARTGGGSYAELDGEAVFELAAAASGAASYTSACVYDMTDDEIYVEVRAVAKGSSDAMTFLRLDADAGDRVSLHERSGSLHMIVASDGSTTTISLGFREGDDRWWKIRGAGDEIEFATSKDGETWSVLHEVAAPPGLDAVRVSIGADAGAGSSGPRSARFDNYNGG